jgi:hypothetical protein
MMVKVRASAQLDLLVELSELVNALLQPLGDRQIGRLNDVTAILRGRRLAAKQQIVDLPVDEVAR